MSGGRAVTASIHEGDEDVAAEAARMHALLKHRVATMDSKTAGLAKASARVQAMQATPGAAAAAAGSDAAVDLSVKFAVEVYGLSKVFKGGARCCALPGCGPRKAKKGAAVVHTAGGSAAARKAAAAARGSGDFWAIKDSWFGIEEGQLFCLLGPNGAGKTTTINCLTGEPVQSCTAGRSSAVCHQQCDAQQC
jgi:ABC-type glutathione transport system ATPase component